MYVEALDLAYADYLTDLKYFKPGDLVLCVSEDGAGNFARYLKDHAAIDITLIYWDMCPDVSIRRSFDVLRHDVRVAPIPYPYDLFQTVILHDQLHRFTRPIETLKNLAFTKVLLLSSIVCDSESLKRPTLDECAQEHTGIIFAPTPSWISQTLRNVGFSHVYCPKVQPDYIDFQWDPHNDQVYMRDKRYLRHAFIASKHPIYNLGHLS